MWRVRPKNNIADAVVSTVWLCVLFYGEVGLNRVVPLSSSRKIKVEIEPKLVL